MPAYSCGISPTHFYYMALLVLTHCYLQAVGIQGHWDGDSEAAVDPITGQRVVEEHPLFVVGGGCKANGGIDCWGAVCQGHLGLWV